MDLTPKQQASEAIRQAESIMLVTAQRPNIDQIASMVALTHALRKLGKKVSPIVTDRIPRGVEFIAKGKVETSLAGLRDFIVQLDVSRAEVDKLKYEVADGKLNVSITPFSGSFTPADVTFAQGDYHFDLIIALGVPTRQRLDKIFEQNPKLLATVPMLNLDYHRINEQHGAINLIEGNSSTLSEMVLALTESLQGGLLDEDIANALLTGIIANTDRFAAQHTTAKSLTVAAQMMAMGANQQRVIKELYGNQSQDRPRNDDRPKRQDDRNRRNDDQRGGKSRSPETGTRSQDQSSGSSQEQPAPKPVEEPKLVNPGVKPVDTKPEPFPEQAPAPKVEEPTREPEPLPEPAPEPAVEPETSSSVDAEIDAFIHGRLDAAEDDLVYTEPEPVINDKSDEKTLQWEAPAEQPIEEGQVVDLPNEGEPTGDSLINFSPSQA